MRAVVQEAYGDAEDVLSLADVEPPEIGDDEVLIRVFAAGIDRGVWHLMTGLPYLIRVAGFGLRKPKNHIRGLDAAGIVESVGPDVATFEPGDEVYGIVEGSFAEFAAAKPKKLAPKPAGLSFEQAAVVPVSGLAALQGLRDKGGIRPGQEVLVTGASGGVGTFAVQIARALGATVSGVSSGVKADLVRSLGAERVFDYEKEDFTESGERFDLILDVAGNRGISDLRRALTRKGTLVIAGGEGKGRLLGGTDRQIRAAMASPFVSQKLTSLISSENGDDIRALTDLIDAGELAPSIGQTRELEDVPEAIAQLRDGQVRGKVAVTIGNAHPDGYSGRSQQPNEE